MSMNTFGHIFRVTTWGESHGPALGATVDGVPPGVPVTEEALQLWLDRRRPGQSRYTTQRREADQVEILSGTFEGLTTGAPVQLMIRNTDQRSKDYSEIADRFRPGHADLTYHLKYGLRDYRGGGRSSARETAARVAAGGIARAALAQMAPQLSILGYLTRIGPHAIDRARLDPEESTATRSSPPTPGGRDLGQLSGRAAQGRRQRRGRDRAGRLRRTGGPWRADLRQARHRPRRRLHVDQRGQGRGDRRGHGGGASDRQRQCRRDPARQ